MKILKELQEGGMEISAEEEAKVTGTEHLVGILEGYKLNSFFRSPVHGDGSIYFVSTPSRLSIEAPRAKKGFSDIVVNIIRQAGIQTVYMKEVEIPGLYLTAIGTKFPPLVTGDKIQVVQVTAEDNIPLTEEIEVSKAGISDEGAAIIDGIAEALAGRLDNGFATMTQTLQKTLDTTAKNLGAMSTTLNALAEKVEKSAKSGTVTHLHSEVMKEVAALQKLVEESLSIEAEFSNTGEIIAEQEGETPSLFKKNSDKVAPAKKIFQEQTELTPKPQNPPSEPVPPAVSTEQKPKHQELSDEDFFSNDDDDMDGFG